MNNEILLFLLLFCGLSISNALSLCTCSNNQTPPTTATVDDCGDCSAGYLSNPCANIQPPATSFSCTYPRNDDISCSDSSMQECYDSATSNPGSKVQCDTCACGAICDESCSSATDKCYVSYDPEDGSITCSTSINSGAVAGIVIGCFLFITLCVLVGCFFFNASFKNFILNCRRSTGSSSKQPEGATTECVPNPISKA